ncbi:family 26 glycoside hydrolase [Phakopsora pachyrhizi]|uniref:Family 26 glycoside hydrolase n=1 Tax=Phakopsora pachyrhizi TaxID=170000 RepID=A0AAV0AKF2_PHAPC|nr:family 26 glycoside hydrolase [Phakopsora pachyrhizi]
MCNLIKLALFSPVLTGYAHKVALKMKQINDQGVKVWLRFGHEMNGDWDKWGMNPRKFVQKWRILAKAVKSTTSGTYMLWSPNAMFGRSVHDVHGGYTPYWPGADVVDIAGISFYHWGDNSRRVNIAPTPQEAVQKLKDFSTLYGPGGWGKPIVVAETAASYTYDRGTRTPVKGGASEYKIKLTWLHLLLDKYIKQTIPGLRAITWFEVIKDENATGKTPVKTEDFRLVLGNPRVGAAANAFFTNLQH